METKKTTYVIASGSGGHIIPAIAYTKDRSPENKIIFITGHHPLEKQLIPDTTEPIRYASLQFPGKKIWLYPLFVWRFCSIFFQSLFLFFKTSGDKEIITTGGVLSIPVACAGKLLRIPLTLIELNAIPGKTTRFLSPVANEILTVFDLEQSDKRHRVIDYPLRSFKTNMTLEKDSSTFVIAVFGGSQGSKELNDFFTNWLVTHKNYFAKLKIYHFYGNDQSVNYQRWYDNRKIDAITASWCEYPETIYAIAHLVFTRGGSGTLHELLHFQTKSVILPLRTVADDHQYKNAIAVQKKHPHLFYCVTSEHNKQNLNNFIHSKY